MECHEFHELIHRFVDNELGDGQSRVLRDHLAQCAGCAKLLEQYERLKDLSQPETVEPPPELRPRILKALRAESSALRAESSALRAKGPALRAETNGVALERVILLFRRAAVAALLFVSTSAALFFGQLGTLQADDKPAHYEDLFSISSPEDALEALIHTTTQKDAIRRFLNEER